MLQKAIALVLLVSLGGCAGLLRPRPDAAAPLGPAFQFEGVYLVAVEGAARDLDRVAPTSATNPRVLFDTAIAGDCVSVPAEPTAASQPMRRWLVYETSRAHGDASDLASGVDAWSVAYAATPLAGRSGGATRRESPAAVELTSLLSRLSSAPGVRVAAVEPSVRYVDARLFAALVAAAEQGLTDACSVPPPPAGASATCTLEVCRGPSVHWPAGSGFASHLEGNRSQLASARRATPGPPGEGITIAHLDTGYPGPRDTESCDVPRGFDASASCNFVPSGTCADACATDPCEPLPLSQCGHGTGTLALLAGGRMEASNPPFDDDLGGAPDARIVEYRISDYVVHPYPVVMAAAIDWASRSAQAVDVVSMSMGGLPSGALRDAVNNAYCRGVALFTASGNHVVLPPFSTPRHVVYPAAFSRVVAVTGATADQRSYGVVPGWASLLQTCDWSYWLMRGNFGPPSSMGAALAGYTANVPFLRHWKKGGGRRDRVDLDGTGTSSATPQVAAAAALWLQTQRMAIEGAGQWRSWRKPEAVYHALFEGAKKDVPSEAYSRRYFGQGILRAHEALAVKYDGALAERPPAAIDWIEVARFLFSGLCPRAARATDACLLWTTMLGTELAQAVARSATVQRQLELAAVAPADLAFTPAAHRDLWRAIAAVPGKSKELRAALVAGPLAIDRVKR